MSQLLLDSLQSLLHRLRLESHHLQDDAASRQPQHLWQQLLPRTAPVIRQPLTNLLCQKLHWLPRWGHQRYSSAVEQTLVGHDSWVRSLVVVDSQRIISASYDRTIKVWNLITGQVEQTLIGHDEGVRSVTIVDTQRIISASADRTLKVWNFTTSQVIASIGLDGVPECVAVARQDGRMLVVTGDAGGALYCLALVEPVAGTQ